jgi:hypothetical protein
LWGSFCLPFGSEALMDYLIYIEVKIVDLFNKLIKIVNIKIRLKKF